MVDEYVYVDNMQPRVAIMTVCGITVATYFTKPTTKNRSDRPQEIHMLTLCPRAPAEIMEFYDG